MSIKKNLKFDDFIDSIRKNTKSVEQLSVLQGYIGKSDLSDHVRIYFDEELNNFVEILESEIIHSIANEKSEDPLGGSRIWVKETAVLTMGDPNMVNRPKSSLVEGDMMQAYSNMGYALNDKENQANNFQVPFTRIPACGPITVTSPACFRTIREPRCFQTLRVPCTIITRPNRCPIQTLRCPTLICPQPTTTINPTVIRPGQGFGSGYEGDFNPYAGY